MERKYSPEFHDLIDAEDIPGIHAFLKQDPSMLHAETPFGSWLDLAASEGQLALCQLFVELGLDVNRVNHNNLTPLRNAAGSGRVEVVRYLLDQGARAQPHDLTDEPANPIFGAIHSKSPAIAQLLLDHGLDAAIEYANGKTAANFALLYGVPEVAQVIINHLAGGDPAKAADILRTQQAIADRHS